MAGGFPTFRPDPSRFQLATPSVQAVSDSRGSPPPVPRPSSPLVSVRGLMGILQTAGLAVDGDTERYLHDLRITQTEVVRALKMFRHYEEVAARVAVETRTEGTIPGMGLKLEGRILFGE